MKFHITPHTKIMDILNAYPEAEEHLINLVPMFEKLRNPILRNTVGKLATIEQASQIGNITVPYLINYLNERLNLVQENLEIKESSKSLDELSVNKVVVEVIDADVLINTGQKPVVIVMSKANKLNTDQSLRLDCSFYPAPLLDKIREMSFKVSEYKNTDYSHSFLIYR